MKFNSILKALLFINFQLGSAFLFSQTTIYNSANSGLANNAVRCIAVDTNNIVWVGHDLGLSRFDGTNWINFNPQNSPLNDYYVRCLKIDSLNRLWIGTLDHGIYIYDGTAWDSVNVLNSGIPDNCIRDIDFGLTVGEIWVATAAGLGYYDGFVWTNWNALNSGFFTNNISSVAISPTNEKNIGTLNGGLHILDTTNNLSLYTHFNSGLPDNTQYNVELDANGLLWMATPSAGLLVHLAGDNWLWYTEANGTFPTNSTTNVLLDNGLVYVSTYDKGLIVFDGNNSSEYNVANSGFPENFIHCMAIDKNGVLWLGTDVSGLIRFDRALAINEYNADKKIHAWPNILNEGNRCIRIETEERNLTYFVLDINGRMISSGKVFNSLVELKNITPGSYFLRITNENTDETVRFIVVD